MLRLCRACYYECLYYGSFLRVQNMSRRHFDDYDAKEWQEEHSRVAKERRKRDAKKHRHQTDDEALEAPGRPRSPRPSH